MEDKERKNKILANISFYWSLILWVHLILFYIVNQLYDKGHKFPLFDLVGVLFLLWILFLLSSFIPFILSIVAINFSNKYLEEKNKVIYYLFNSSNNLHNIQSVHNSKY
ncbi:hypothetical protein HYV50_04605 [Candidatus Pacearchaeota archaeon]|nr:hypothetical protein [Candidatus Pacearchaeota archaeon]